RSSKVRVPHRPRTDPAEAGSPERDDRPEPPHRGGTRKTVALGPGCAAPSCPPPSRIAPGRRNHARRLSSTDFCNTICQKLTFAWTRVGGVSLLWMDLLQSDA